MVFQLARASLDLKMKRKGVLFTCLNDGCSVLVMGELLRFVLTVRACAGVENTCAGSVFDDMWVSGCVCVVCACG